MFFMGGLRSGGFLYCGEIWGNYSQRDWRRVGIFIELEMAPFWIIARSKNR
jgi:hypothetical protein